MSFATFKGQDSAISFLKNSIEKNKLSHAYIFLGPEGIGKRLAAINFAKVLNCANSVSHEPCDACSSCKKIDASSHPDIFILKAEEEGSAIGIDEIRELIKNIYLRPFEAKKKVYIMQHQV